MSASSATDRPRSRRSSRRSRRRQWAGPPHRDPRRSPGRVPLRSSRTDGSSEFARATRVPGPGSCRLSQRNCGPRPRRRPEAQGQGRRDRPSHELRHRFQMPHARRPGQSGSRSRPYRSADRRSCRGGRGPGAASRRRLPRARCRSERSARASGSARALRSASRRECPGRRRWSRNTRGSQGAASAWHWARSDACSRPGSPRSALGSPVPTWGTAVAASRARSPGRRPATRSSRGSRPSRPQRRAPPPGRPRDPCRAGHRSGRVGSPGQCMAAGVESGGQGRRCQYAGAFLPTRCESIQRRPSCQNSPEPPIPRRIASASHAAHQCSASSGDNPEPMRALRHPDRRA